MDQSFDTSEPTNKGILSFIGNTQIEPCDKITCHTLKQNIPQGAHEKNNDNYNNQKEPDNKDNDIYSSAYKFNLEDKQLQQQQDNLNISITEKFNQHNNNNFKHTLTTTTNAKSSIEEQRNNLSSSPISLERVTKSHGLNCHMDSKPSLVIKENRTDHTFNFIFQEILNIVKLSNGLSMSFNSAIESICKSNEHIKKYLGNKITARENRIVRDLQLKIIRHPNIEVIKPKPQLLIKWCENDTISNNGGNT